MSLKFKIEEINEKELQKLGVTKQDIVSLPPRTFKALLSGQRTTLMHFNQVDISGNKSQLDAKLSLIRNTDGNAELRVHPVNAYAANIFNLGPDKIEDLQSGKKKNVLIKDLVNGEEKKTLVYYDKDTNEFVGIDQSKLKAPEKINDLTLSEEQKINLQEGKPITIKNSDGKEEDIIIDPTNEIGIRSSSGHFNSIEWQHSRYKADELAYDIALLMSGAGTVMMIGHLADLVLNTFNKTIENNKRLNRSVNPESLNDKNLRQSLIKSFPELKEKWEKNEKVTPKELKRIIENHLNRPIEIENINTNALDLKKGASQNVNVINENATEAKIENQLDNVDANDKLSHEHKHDAKDEIKQETPQQQSRMKY